MITLEPRTEGVPVLNLDERIAALGLDEKRIRPDQWIVATGIWTWLMALPVAAKLVFGAIAIAGLMYVSRLLSRPSLDITVSRTYTFGARRNTTGVGLPVPVIYGQHRAFGHIVQQFVESENDTEFLYTLLALSEGPIDSITSVEINDQPSVNFSDVTLETRRGDTPQTAIPWFQDTRNAFSVGVALNSDGSSHTYTTASTQVEAFIVKVRFAAGMGNGQDANRVRVRIEYRVSGGGGFTLLGEFDVSENKPNTNFTRQWRKDNLAKAQYDIRVTRVSTAVNTPQNPSPSMTFDTADEITYGTNTYPNIALLGVKIKASEQLSGEAPKISAIVKGRKVRVLTGGSLGAEAWSQNPVECLIDAMTNTRYGLGAYIPDGDLVLSAFQTARDYCNDTVTDPVSEARHKLDLVCDERKAFFDWLELILNAFRGYLIESDGKWRLDVDHTKAVSQVFSDANIKRETFVNYWVSLGEEYDQVEVVFLDEGNDYIRESVRFPSTGTKTKTIQLYGVTRRSHALREAKYHMNAITALSRFVEFDCAIEALAVEVGDIIQVSHNVPQWGYSGRVTVVATADAGVNHVITVDRDDLPTTGLGSYALLIRKHDDSIEQKNTILSVGTPYTSSEGYPRQDVKVSGLFSPVPVVRDSVWAFGLTAEVAKKFRVMAITLNEDLTRHVMAFEYNATIYDSSGLVLPTRSPSLLPNPEAPPNSVTSLTLSARKVIASDGSYVAFVDAAWNQPAFSTGKGQFAYARVYYSLYQGVDADLIINSAVYAGRSDTYKMTLGPFPTNLGGATTKVTVYVVAVSVREVAQYLSSAATSNTTVTGDVTTPATPSGLVGAFFGKVVELRWNPNGEADLDEYEVWRSTTNDSATAAKIAEVRTTKFIDTNVVLNTAYFYWIKAADRSGNISGFHPGQFAGVAVTPDEIANTEVDPTAPSVPTGLAVSGSGSYLSGDGTIQSFVTLSWTNPVDDRRAYVDVLYKRSGGADYIIADQVTGTTGRIDDLNPGVAYDIAARAVSRFGVYSTLVTTTSTPVGDTTAPATPTGFTMEADVGGVKMAITANTETDLAGYEFHVGTSVGFTPGAGTLVFKGIATTIRVAVPDGAIRYGKIKAFDRSGNSSGYTSELSAIPRFTFAVATSTGGAQTISTTEVDLLVYTLPANTMSENGKAVRIRTWVNTVSGLTGTELKLYFGATEIIMVNGTASLASDIDSVVIRTGASAQKATCSRVSSAGFLGNAKQTSPAESTAGTITIKVTGKSADGVDIARCEALIVEFVN